MTEGQQTTGVEILDRIVAVKRAEVAELHQLRGALEKAALGAAPPRPILEPLRASSEVGVFAEVKRRSPGAGAIDPDLDPLRLSAAFEAGGACGLSVLTDAPFFGGSLADLEEVRRARVLPVLRKDFVLDPIQVWEARAAGADVVLLIARLLGPGLLADLRALVHELGMVALVEVHDEEEVGPALASGASLVGVNNRDLSVFRTDLAVTERVARLIPGDVLLVSESGIRGPDDVARVAAAGADAVLVGEALVRHPRPEDAVRALAEIPRVSCRA